MLTIGRNFSYSLKIQKNIQDISWLILISEIGLLNLLISSQKVNFCRRTPISLNVSFYLSLTEFLISDFRTLYLSSQWSDSDDIWHTSQPEDVADDTNVRTAANTCQQLLPAIILFTIAENWCSRPCIKKTCLLKNLEIPLKVSVAQKLTPVRIFLC